VARLARIWRDWRDWRESGAITENLEIGHPHRAQFVQASDMPGPACTKPLPGFIVSDNCDFSPERAVRAVCLWAVRAGSKPRHCSARA
jgi:hypothetical protein